MAGHWMIIGGEQVPVNPNKEEAAGLSESKLAVAMWECIEDDAEKAEADKNKKAKS